MLVSTELGVAFVAVSPGALVLVLIFGQVLRRTRFQLRLSLGGQ